MAVDGFEATLRKLTVRNDSTSTRPRPRLGLAVGCDLDAALEDELESATDEPALT